MRNVEEQFQAIAYQYGQVEADEAMSRYELTVNWPSIAAMLPKSPAKLLDYGCGSGVYSRKLLALGYDVLAVDNARDMLEQMKDIQERVRLWSYQGEPLPEKFDAIIAKLVVQFVNNLPAFARAMRNQLLPGGSVIISVPHPDRSRQLAGNDGSYRTQIGSSGLYVHMIHRELQQYKDAFTAAGFRLTATGEPLDKTAPGEPPKRLNLRFTAEPAS